MPDLTKIKRSLAHASVKELYDIIRYAKARVKELEKREYEAKVEEAWSRAKEWAKMYDVKTETVYVCSEATHIGSPIQRGDALTVVCLQPRAKRLWLKFKGKEYAFRPQDIKRFNLQAEPPEKPISEADRQMADRMASRLAKALK